MSKPVFEGDMNKLKYFIEIGANLEHERWVKWQRYVHKLCKKNKDGSLTISYERVAHWERQIKTSYNDLPEMEKEYDREEVRKYFPLLRKLGWLNKEELIKTPMNLRGWSLF